ncbi:MAG: hypothetical protein WB443_11925 [Nitrososphaeraceae archaeon]
MRLMPVIEKDCSEIVDFAQTRKEYELAGYVATQMNCLSKYKYM